jgi:hypothetical protein
MTLQASDIEATVHDISQFFTDWVGGRCPGDDATFAKNALDRLSDELIVIMPGGRSFGKRDFAGYMRGIYGSNPEFRIKICDFRVSHQGDDLAVVNYCEWQRNAKDSDPPNNGRVTTMVVRDRGASRDPEIMQVHETWLPNDIVRDADFDF